MSNAVTLNQREKLVLHILNLIDARTGEVQLDLVNEVLGRKTAHATSRENLAAVRSFIEDARRILIDLQLPEGRAS